MNSFYKSNDESIGLQYISFFNIAMIEEQIPILRNGKYNNFINFKSKFFKYLHTLHPNLCSHFITGVPIDNIIYNKENVHPNMDDLLNVINHRKEYINLEAEKTALYNF